MALELIVEAKKDVLVILSTGGGEELVLSAGDDSDRYDDDGSSSVGRGNAGFQVYMHRLRDQRVQIGILLNCVVSPPVRLRDDKHITE
jgi:hypothetical protein